MLLYYKIRASILAMFQDLLLFFNLVKQTCEGASILSDNSKIVFLK